MRLRWIIALSLIVGIALAALLVSYAAPWGESTPSPALVTEEDEDFGTVTVYAVLDDGSLDPAATGLALEVWETFTRVATPEFVSSVMMQYRVGDAPASDTLAYVYQDDDPQYWILAANLATSDDPQQLVATLIHEYAHTLTLSTDELEVVPECDTLELEEGCALSDSILGEFAQEFWSAYGDDAPDAANTDADVAYEFYLANEDDFVSDYAATNIVEDVAESFMTFVLEDEPTGDSIAALKLAFLWERPDLVEIRERIRSEFAEDLGLVG